MYVFALYGAIDGVPFLQTIKDLHSRGVENPLAQCHECLCADLSRGEFVCSTHPYIPRTAFFNHMPHSGYHYKRK